MLLWLLSLQTMLVVVVVAADVVAMYVLLFFHHRIPSECLSVCVTQCGNIGALTVKSCDVRVVGKWNC